MIANKYLPISKIGNGKFGTIYSGKYVRTNEPIAIKIEQSNTELLTLKHETTILNYLYTKGSVYTPRVYWYGIHLKHYVLIMPLYEYSLEDMIQKHTMSKIQSIKIVSKMMDILDTIHHLDVIHRDIKPHNFMVKENDIYLIDFGLSTIYISDDEVKPPSCYILGTPKFVSIHIHNGETPSRRDDCISVMYILLYMLLDGHLQWSNVQDSPNIPENIPENHILYHKNMNRKRMKMEHLESVTDESFFGIILKYLYELKKHERPNYQWIRSIMTNE